MEKTIHNLFYVACRKTIVLIGLMLVAVNGWAQETIEPTTENDPLKEYYNSDGYYDFTGTDFLEISSKFDDFSSSGRTWHEGKYSIDYSNYDCRISSSDYGPYYSTYDDIFNTVYTLIEFYPGSSDTDPLYDHFYDTSNSVYNLTSDFRSGYSFPDWLCNMENGTYIDTDNSFIYININYSGYDCWVDEDEYNPSLDDVFDDVYHVVSFEAGNSTSDMFSDYYNSGEYDFTQVSGSKILDVFSNVGDGKYTDGKKKIIYIGIDYTSYDCWINEIEDADNFDSYFGDVFVVFKAGDSDQDPFHEYYIQLEDGGYYDFTKIESYSSIKEDILSKITGNTWENANGNTISKIDFTGYDCLLHGYFLSELGSDFSELGFNIKRLSNTITESTNESEKYVPNVQYDGKIENLYIVDFAELKNLSSEDDINSGYTMLSGITTGGNKPTVKKVTYSRNVGDGTELQWITVCLPFAYSSSDVTCFRKVNDEWKDSSFSMFKFDGKYEGNEVLNINGTEYSKDAKTMMFTDISSAEAGEAILICTNAQTIEITKSATKDEPIKFSLEQSYNADPKVIEGDDAFDYFRGCLTLNDGEDKATDLTPPGFTMYKVSPTVNYVESTESSKVWVTDTEEPSDAYWPSDPTGNETDNQFKQEIQDKFENDYSYLDNLKVLGVTIKGKVYYYDIDYYPMAEDYFEYPSAVTGESYTDEDLTEERVKEIFNAYISQNSSIEKAQYKGFTQNGSDGEYYYTITYDAVGSSYQTYNDSGSDPSLDSYITNITDFGKLYSSSLKVEVSYSVEYKYLSENSEDGATSYGYLATGTLLKCLDTGNSEEFDSWIYPNRCYLVLPSNLANDPQNPQANLRMIVKWSDTSDELLAIEDVTIDENGNLAAKDKRIFSISGTLVNTSGDRSALAPGLYIQGGKKFVVR